MLDFIQRLLVFYFIFRFSTKTKFHLRWRNIWTKLFQRISARDWWLTAVIYFSYVRSSWGEQWQKYGTCGLKTSDQLTPLWMPIEGATGPTWTDEPQSEKLYRSWHPRFKRVHTEVSRALEGRKIVNTEAESHCTRPVVLAIVVTAVHLIGMLVAMGNTWDSETHVTTIWVLKCITSLLYVYILIFPTLPPWSAEEASESKGIHTWRCKFISHRNNEQTFFYYFSILFPSRLATNDRIRFTGWVGASKLYKISHQEGNLNSPTSILIALLALPPANRDKLKMNQKITRRRFPHVSSHVLDN